MTEIDCLIAEIYDELDGAKKYAEKYLDYKASNSQFSKLYGTMSEQELSHATNLYTMMKDKIEEAKTSYEPTQDMLDSWEKVTKQYAEKLAFVKQILSL